MLFSCNNQTEEQGPHLEGRDSLPTLRTLGVSTLVSDSGIIRYKIIAEEWFIYDKKDPQYWSFQKGLFIETFDRSFQAEAFISCDTAYHFYNRNLWELRGRVLIRNVNGLVFRSEEFFWDGIRHEFYSHKFSRLVTPERTLEGTYFRSDEHMTHYEVTNSVGSFQSSDMEGEQEQSSSKSSSAAPADSAAPAPPVRQAATRHKAAQKSVYQP
jgi:hypothetical protein